MHNGGWNQVGCADVLGVGKQGGSHASYQHNVTHWFDAQALPLLGAQHVVGEHVTVDIVLAGDPRILLKRDRGSEGVGARW